jgi:hypothetical protein
MDVWGCDQKTTYLFLAHSANDGDQEIFSIVKVGLDLFAEIALGDFDVVFSDAILGHEVEKTVIDINLKAGIMSYGG